ncbi:MAG: hypothetical protein J1F03_05455 [Oscillospiraceae bacterium]|nr:hypothetical protein [Oscillospiraceae bacterium]
MNLEISNYKTAFSNFVSKNVVFEKLSESEKLEPVQKRDLAEFSDRALEIIREAARSAQSARSDKCKISAELQAKAESAKESEGSYWKEQPSAVQSAENNSGSEKSEQKTLAEMVKEQMDKIDSMFAEKEYDKSKDSKLLGIKGKIYRGLNLTPAEQQYLASKDPDSYSTFQQINSARKMFSCSLRSCRTRDEVNSMRLSNALTALSEYRKAIRKGGDGNAIAGLNAALEREIQSYARTREYQSLPTAAECNKFDRELAKAKRYECEKRREEFKARTDKKYKKKHKTVGDGKRTVAQVMASPLARKVLASRRRTSSCSCGGAVDLKLSDKYKIKGT